MIKKFIAWLLSIIASLFSGLGFHMQEPQVYQGVPGYEVHAPEVDYYDLYATYIENKSASGETCKVESSDLSSLQKVGVNGFGFIVANAPYNPDARLEFSDDSKIIAPGSCKIESEPNSLDGKIIVTGDKPGIDGWKMEILNPKKWYCCENIQAKVSGHFNHVHDSHKIGLRQGQLIAIASSETSILLYRSDASGTMKKVDSLRDFLRSTTQESGQSNKNISGDENTKKTDNIFAGLNLNQSKFYNGSGQWHGYADRWWFGETSYTRAGYDFAAAQWLESESGGIKHLYYFDDAGWMVTGAYTVDNKEYYFTTIQEATNDQPVGSVRVNKLARIGEDRAVWIGPDGIKGIGQDNLSMGGDTYTRQSDGTYKKQTTGGNSNTQPINNQTEESPQSINQWITVNGRWFYYRKERITTDGTSVPESRLGTIYYKRIDGSWFYFKSTGELIVGSPYTVISYNNANYLVNEGGYQVESENWYGDDVTGWYYVQSNGQVAVSARLTIRGVEYSFDSNGLWVE